MAEKNKLSRFAIAMIVFAISGALCIPCSGILAAIAIPGFVGYIRRSKAAEATTNLASIRSGITEYATRESVSATGELRGPQWIESLPATPPVAGVGAMKRVWPADAAEGWTTIGFQPTEPLYYAYSVTTDAVANTVVIEAVGDLDDDGVNSSFSQRGHLEPSGDITWDEVIVLNELE